MTATCDQVRYSPHMTIPHDPIAAWLQTGSLASLVCALALTSGVRPAKADDPPVSAPASTPASAPARLAPAGFATGEELIARLDLIAKSRGIPYSARTIGFSLEKRPLQLFVFGNQDFSKRRPAILLVGGMDAAQLASPECVIESVATIVQEKPGLLEHVRIYALPLANPDARAIALATALPRATNARAVDSDRDGATDEDAPIDVNNDGAIRDMRMPAPPGTAPTHVVDSADPRITRLPNREKGERATHVVASEGLDVDGDTRVGEDPRDGVDLDRNFPHRYPEFDPDAGLFQLSEPEAMAIASFVRDHPDILSAVVFGRHDTLVNFPDTKDNDSTGRTPMVYHTDDHGLYREIAKVWKDTTKIERSANRDLAGSLVLWLANHRGVAAVAANGWSRPELPKPPEGTPAPPETGDPERAAWLGVSDTLYGGAGLSPWTAFDHPKFGKVEIGGIAPFLTESPNMEQASALARSAGAFVAALAERRPQLEVSDAAVTPLADGLIRVELRVTNIGVAPTATAMSAIADAAPPIIVRVPLKPESVFSGRPVEKIERIAAGESREFAWILRTDPKETLAITVTGAWFDPIVRPISPTPAKEAAR
jgi:hypothetical protein